MQQHDLVSGFSQLKNLMIQTYRIDRDKTLVKLYFSQQSCELLMHDYSDHKKVMTLATNLAHQEIKATIKGKARLIVEESLKHKSPAEFLNTGFKLYGFFKL